MWVIDAKPVTMKKLWLVALALLALTACGNKGPKKPETFLSEQQMIDVLTDSYLIEADLNQRKSVGENVSKLEAAYYQQLFEHYGITDTIFDENLAYYTTQLPTLERIMDSVNNRFVKAQPSQPSQSSQPSQQKKFERDDKNILDIKKPQQ